LTLAIFPRKLRRMAKKISGAKTSSEVAPVALRPALPRSARQVTRFWKEEQRTIILLTVKELLDGNFAHKLV
jgi:hypothetical protein